MYVVRASARVKEGNKRIDKKNTAVFSVRTSTGNNVVKPILTNQLHLRTKFLGLPHY